MTRVAPLLILAVLALAAVLYADTPAQKKVPQGCNITKTLSSYTGEARGASITIGGSMEVWGIPRMSSTGFFYRAVGDALTIAAKPEETNGHYRIEIEINYIESYKYTVTTYLLQCRSGNQTYNKTWTYFEHVENVEKTYKISKTFPLQFSITLEQVTLDAAPLCRQAAQADAYDDWCNDNPQNSITYRVTLLNDQTKLSGLSIGDENRGRMFYVGTKVRTLELEFKNGQPPGTVSTGSASCDGKCGVKVSISGTTALINGYSQGGFRGSLRLTAALKQWHTTELRYKDAWGWSGRLMPLVFIYFPEKDTHYIGPAWTPIPETPYMLVETVPNPCDWRLWNGPLQQVYCPSCSLPQALSVGLAKYGYRYGEWERLSLKCSNTDPVLGRFETYIVYAWQYLPDLPTELYLYAGSAQALAPGKITIWIPFGGVAPLFTWAFGYFTDLDGARRPVYHLMVSWYPETITRDPEATCTTFGCSSIAWADTFTEIAGTPDGNQLVFWGFPEFSGGRPLKWIAAYSRSPNIGSGGAYVYIPITEFEYYVGSADGAKDPLPTGWSGLAFLSHYTYFDYVKFLEGAANGQLNYKKTQDMPFTAEGPGASVAVVADVATAYGATPFAVSAGGGKGEPPPAIGNCTLTSVIAVSAAPGAWTTSPRAYATAPAWFAWPGMPFVLAVKVPYSLNCPDQLTAKVYVYANYTCRGQCNRSGWLYLGQFTLSKGQAAFIGPNASAPYRPVVCGQFTDTGLRDWLNAPKQPGTYPIRIVWEGYVNGKRVSKTEHLVYEVKNVEVEWETEVPAYKAINEPTAVLRMWLRFAGTDKYAPWWPYGVGRGGLAAPDGCTAVYEAEEVPSDTAWSTHFGDLAATYVNYVTAQPEVRYSPNDRKVYISAPYAQGWYVYINRGGTWRLVGTIPSQTIVVSTNVTVPAWPWDPVMLVPITSTSSVGGAVTYPRPGYVLFFNFWSLPLSNPPAQSDPAALVRLLGGIVVGP